MATVPPIAKVICPASTGYFPRYRLYRLLDKARKAPVLWITGPPGCGKTALVSSYIESRRLPYLWYKVDEADADLSTFFYFLGLAAAKAAPRKRKHLPPLTPDLPSLDERAGLQTPPFLFASPYGLQTPTRKGILLA